MRAAHPGPSVLPPRLLGGSGGGGGATPQKGRELGALPAPQFKGLRPYAPQGEAGDHEGLRARGGATHGDWQAHGRVTGADGG